MESSEAKIKNGIAPLVVGLTGGIASGKSLVSDLFASWGATVVDADNLARDVVSPGSSVLQEVVASFGTAYLNSDSSLNRPAMARLVFSDPASRSRLEKIIHPAVRAAWLARLAILKETPSISLIVYTVPLLFESREPYTELQKIVLVTAPEKVRIERALKRDGSSPEEIQRRMAAQLPDSEKIPRADYVIENDSNKADLERKARIVFDALSAKI